MVMSIVERFKKSDHGRMREICSPFTKDFRQVGVVFKRIKADDMEERPAWKALGALLTKTTMLSPRNIRVHEVKIGNMELCTAVKS